MSRLGNSWTAPVSTKTDQGHLQSDGWASRRDAFCRAETSIDSRADLKKPAWLVHAGEARVQEGLRRAPWRLVDVRDGLDQSEALAQFRR